jgi:ABC-type sugar transport system substrate-binding protein
MKIKTFISAKTKGRSRRFLATGALLAAVVTAFSVPHGARAAGSEPTIGVTFDKMDDTFRIGEKKYLDMYAQQMGIKLIYDDAQQSAATQSSQVRTLIAQQVAGIVEIPWDTHAVAADVSAAKLAKIPLAVMDQEPASTADLFYYVGGSPCGDGRMAGEFMVTEAAKGKHLNVLELLGSLNSANGLERSGCFEKAVASSSNITIVAKSPTNWRTNEAFKATQNALQQHPNINAVYTPWTGGLPAIYASLKAVHRLFPVGNPDHVVTVSINGDQIGCQYVGGNMDDLDIATPLPAMANSALVAIANSINKHENPSPNVVELPGLPYTPANFVQMKSKVWGCGG